VPHQRCWAHKLRNLENKLKAPSKTGFDQAKLIYQAPHALKPSAASAMETALGTRRAQPWPAGNGLGRILAFLLSAHWKRRHHHVIERLFVKCVAASAPGAPLPPRTV